MKTTELVGLWRIINRKGWSARKTAVFHIVALADLLTANPVAAAASVPFSSTSTKTIKVRKLLVKKVQLLPK